MKETLERVSDVSEESVRERLPPLCGDGDCGRECDEEEEEEVEEDENEEVEVEVEEE